MYNIVNSPYRSASGTSFHGTVIKTTINQLKANFGRPSIELNNGSDKINIEWVGSLKRHSSGAGKVFTIYDWKEYRSIGEDELIEFHIGGNNKADTDMAGNELNRLIMKSIGIGSIVLYNGNWYRVSALRANWVNLKSIFGNTIYHKRIPVTEVMEDEVNWYNWWVQSETYMSM